MWSKTMGTCKACQRLEGYLFPKPVKYCKACDAWMCHDCWFSPIRRFKAAIYRTEEVHP